MRAISKGLLFGAGFAAFLAVRTAITGENVPENRNEAIGFFIGIWTIPFVFLVIGLHLRRKANATDPTPPTRTVTNADGKTQIVPRRKS